MRIKTLQYPRKCLKAKLERNTWFTADWRLGQLAFRRFKMVRKTKATARLKIPYSLI